MSHLSGGDHRIRVCLLCDTLGYPAGTERQVFETAKRLDGTSFDVHVACLEPSRQLEELSNCCSTVVFPTLAINSASGIRAVWRMRRYFARHRIQIVHAYMNKTAMFAVASSLASNRTVITSRLNTGYWYTPGWQRFFRLLNAGTTRIMANSEEAKRIAVAAEQVSPEKVDVVYQGVDMSRYSARLGDPSASERLGIDPAHRVVGMVANLRPVKDVPLFLRAAAVVARPFPDVSFLIAGRGEQLEELQKLAAELGIADRVFFTRGEGNVVDYLARMSVGCLTSQSEGFSNAILEYMAAGLPVVATDVGGNREAIVAGETGYLVRERTPEAIAQPILQLLSDEDRRRRMGAAGFARCAENFELGKTIRNLEDYYAELVGRMPNGSRGKAHSA